MLHTKTTQKYDCPTYLIFPKVNEFVTKQRSPRCTYFASGFWKTFPLNLLPQILDFHGKREKMLKTLPGIARGWAFLGELEDELQRREKSHLCLGSGPGSRGKLSCSGCWDDLRVPEGEEANDGERNKRSFIHVGKSAHLIKIIFFLPEVRNRSWIWTLLFLALFTLMT